MEALGINIGYLIVQILGLVILLLLMRGLAYDPIIRLLEQRKARIAKGLEDARQAAIARENADTEAKKILDAARAEAAKIRADAGVQAEEQAQSILANARAEAKRIVEAAAEDATEERNNILAEMRDQVAAIAIAAANKLVDEALDEKRQRTLISEFFAKVPAEVKQLSGRKAEVTSALPLTETEQAQVKKSLGAESIEFKVNPRILGGLVIRVGDQVVDNSVASKMEAMREALA